MRGIITESIDTNTPLGAAVFVILGAVAQLERDLIAERVRNGLANAKAKGIHIGRIKMRDSDLIRKLLSSKITYREIARIAKCSTGAVSAEVRALKAEALIKEKNKALQDALMPKLDLDHSSNVNIAVTGNQYQGQEFDFNNHDNSIQLER
ncbi:MAG: recombinase family protein [Bacteriovorax sp.]|nr:recombinase family protein [Bacteriovorax sp.]